MHKVLLFFKSNLISKQLILYLLVGGINTLFGYSVYAVLIFMKLHYLLASLFSLILGVLFNFFTMGKFVFKKFAICYVKKFIVFYLTLYGVYVLFIKLFSYWQSNMYISGFVGGLLVATLSFIVNKYVIFYKEDLKV